MGMILDDLAVRAAQHMGPGTGCSITLKYGAALHQVGSSSPRAAAVDQVEVEAEQGPCVLAMEQLSGVLVDDITTDTRWPAWRAAANRAGFRSAAALAAYIDDQRTVAFNLYSDRPVVWDAARLVRMDVHVQQLADELRLTSRA
jgi:GAF domain-containing protein